MKRVLIALAVLLSAVTVSASNKLPKAVTKAQQAVAGILTYRNGVLDKNGTVFFVGGGDDVLASYTLLCGVDSAVVVDAKGKARPVKGIVGLNDIYDCVKLRVQSAKKSAYMPIARKAISIGDELYMLAYGKKGSGAVTKVKVSAVDSLYSHAYYTLDIAMQEHYEALPLVNASGELVAMMQPASPGDSCSYAVGATMSDALIANSVSYGKGYYSNMGIRTLLPADKESALSCMYMQAVVGDSLSYANTVNDFIVAFPDSYEGYMSKAEYEAIYRRDMDAALKAWDESVSRSDKPAEVYFNKAKTIYSIVQGGDTVSHPLLKGKFAMEALDKAIETDNQPLYVNYKADVLFNGGQFAEACDCYLSLSETSLRSADLFSKAAQCQSAMKNYDAAIELMDSAVNIVDGVSSKDPLPYVFTRALLKNSAGRYRDAVFDYNLYEEIAGTIPNANFYYLRSQAEVSGKMFQQALNDLEKAISIEPRNATFYLEKGILCYKVNLLEDGAEALEEAKSLAPRVSDIYYLLGCIYSKSGNKDKAVENLQQAIEMGHPDAGNKLNDLK